MKEIKLLVKSFKINKKLKFDLQIRLRFYWQIYYLKMSNVNYQSLKQENESLEQII